MFQNDIVLVTELLHLEVTQPKCIYVLYKGVLLFSKG